MKIQLRHSFEEIINLENLLLAWSEFVKGKRGKPDVQLFQLHLMDNILSLHSDLFHHTYKHGGYQAFNISDPKPRNIHKASVRDRLVHHAIYQKLYPFFDRTFISHSFSCRKAKGTHKAIECFYLFAHKVSRNNTRTGWVLKCDIKKFFANINHKILLDILAKYIPEKNILWLLERVIISFYARPGIGLPLGNLTSQLLVNIYLNELDHFIKHRIKAKYYIRYADDFVLFSEDKLWLEKQIPRIRNFLRQELKLFLHPRKVSIETVAAGVDFLGWIHFSRHRMLRKNTKRRMFARIQKSPTNETLQSYLGLLKHGNSFKVRKKLLERYSLQKRL